MFAYVRKTALYARTMAIRWKRYCVYLGLALSTVAYIAVIASTIGGMESAQLILTKSIRQIEYATNAIGPAADQWHRDQQQLDLQKLDSAHRNDRPTLRKSKRNWRTNENPPTGVQPRVGIPNRKAACGRSSHWCKTFVEKYFILATHTPSLVSLEQDHRGGTSPVLEHHRRLGQVPAAAAAASTTTTTNERPSQIETIVSSEDLAGQRERERMIESGRKWRQLPNIPQISKWSCCLVDNRKISISSHCRMIDSIFSFIAIESNFLFRNFFQHRITVQWVFREWESNPSTTDWTKKLGQWQNTRLGEYMRGIASSETVHYEIERRMLLVSVWLSAKSTIQCGLSLDFSRQCCLEHCILNEILNIEH